MTIMYFTGLIGSVSHTRNSKYENYEFSLAVSEDKKNQDGSYEKLRTNWINCNLFIDMDTSGQENILVVGKRVGVIGYGRIFPRINKSGGAECGITLNVKKIVENENIKVLESNIKSNFDIVEQVKSNISGYENEPDSVYKKEKDIF